MAPRGKRKRKSHLTTPNKRRRTLQSSAASTPVIEHTQPSTQEPEEWPAKRILQESKRKFLVDWEDDPTTGEQYPPSWVWKRDVGTDLIAIWESQKRAKRTSETTEIEETSTNSADLAPTAPPPRRRPVVPSSTPSPQQAQSVDTTSQVLLDTPTPDIGAFVEDTGSPAGSSSYHPSTQEVPSTHVSTSAAPGSNSQILATQEDSGANEDFQGGAQESSTSQEGTSSYHPPPSVSVDGVNATGDTNPEDSELEPTTSPDDVPSAHGADQPEPISSTEFHDIQLPDSYSQEDSTVIIEIPESPAQEEPQSLEQSANTGPLEHIAETQSPLKSRATSVGGASEEGIESGAQSAGEQIEQLDEALLPRPSQEHRDTASDLQIQEQPSLEPQVIEGRKASNSISGSGTSPEQIEELDEGLLPGPSLEHGDTGSDSHGHDPFLIVPQVNEDRKSSQATSGTGTSGLAQKQHSIIELEKLSVTATGTQEPGTHYTLVSDPPREPAPEIVAGLDTAFQAISRDPVQDANTERRDFALTPQSDIVSTQEAVSDKEATQSLSSKHFSDYQEQNAQIVQTSPYSSTQGNSVELVLPTTEVLDPIESEPTTPKSRHDSSQEETPRPEEFSKAERQSEDLSLPAAPPSTSLGGLDSLAPPRLQTPTTISSLRTEMAEKEPESDLKRRFRSLFEKGRSTQPTGSPGVTGTRSPSIIPNRSPQHTGPPSLRNVAAVNSALVQGTDTPQATAWKPSRPDIEPFSSPPVSPAPDTSNAGSEVNASVTGGQSDDDVSSDLEDDLILLTNEYIVPTAMESIQKSTYDAKVTKHKGILNNFVSDPQGFKAMDDLKKFFRELKAIETHVDFDIPESSLDNAGTQYQTRWSEDTAAKFRFLGQFLHGLRYRQLRVVLVLKEENEHMFSLVEKFLKGNHINYYNRARQRGAGPKEWEGPLIVELLTLDLSYVTQPADLIVCLDGATAADVRRKSWAKNTDRNDPTVTVLRLVVPRSLSHIELCVSPKLSEKDRLHKEAACLLQFRGQFGRPLSEKTPRPFEAANIVAQYVIDLDSAEGRPDWPLPGIGSVKEVVEYASSQTQTSTDSAASSVKAVSMKRPLDRSPGEPSKRARLSSNADAETSHVSDSMPGTAVETSELHKQLADMNRKLTLAKQNEQRALDVAKASANRTRELDATLDDRQTNYEDLTRKLRIATSALQDEQTKRERATTLKENADERNKKLQAEITDLKAKLSALQAHTLASPNTQAAEIARLLQEHADMAKKLNSALNDKRSADSMQEYMKDELRSAQTQAAEWKERWETANEEAERLQVLAAGQVTSLKKIHYDRSAELLRQQYERLRIDNENKAKMLQAKEEEIQRLKGGARGYGTRQSSVPRSPRVGSRATSPVSRDRVNTLRNG